jgi:hypothetical protein
MSEFCEYRQSIRLNLNFQANLHTGESDLPVEGMTKNLSQMGSLIKMIEWCDLQLKDRVHVTILIPPTFCGHEESIALQGKAVVKRLDLLNQCVAVQFVKTLKQFDIVNKREILKNNFT